MSVVLFFKQKTAYDVRISDWSSDVCSSDLRAHAARCARRRRGRLQIQAAGRFACAQRTMGRTVQLTQRRSGAIKHGFNARGRCCSTDKQGTPPCSDILFSSSPPSPLPARSEEHTSELQSLMRISYAVFCLKKNITIINTYAK